MATSKFTKEGFFEPNLTKIAESSDRQHKIYQCQGQSCGTPKHNKKHTHSEVKVTKNKSICGSLVRFQLVLKAPIEKVRQISFGTKSEWFSKELNKKKMNNTKKNITKKLKNGQQLLDRTQNAFYTTKTTAHLLLWCGLITLVLHKEGSNNECDKQQPATLTNVWHTKTEKYGDRTERSNTFGAAQITLKHFKFGSIFLCPCIDKLIYCMIGSWIREFLFKVHQYLQLKTASKVYKLWYPKTCVRASSLHNIVYHKTSKVS